MRNPRVGEVPAHVRADVVAALLACGLARKPQRAPCNVALVQLAAAREALDHVPVAVAGGEVHPPRSEEHTSELQSLMRTSYAVFCLKQKQLNTTPYSGPCCSTSNYIPCLRTPIL